jgi:DNA-binding NarL/FixJ family response regulator
VLGHGVAEQIVSGLVGGGDDKNLLSQTERQVLLYVAGGYENADIAKHLQLSQTVVIEALAQAMNKLDAGDRHAAALAALRRGFINLDDLHDLA